jgi:hypothetical protein
VQAPAPPASIAQPRPLDRFEALRAALRDGEAVSLDRIVAALDEPDPMGLANTILHLYLLRERAEVRALLEGLWRGEREAAPGADWDALATPELRVAIAHTIARIDPRRAGELLDYIRAALESPSELAQAQAATALAFVGEETDVTRIAALGRSGGDYAAEAAIKALALRGGDAAREALLDLKARYANDRRKSIVIRQVLAERYPEFRRGFASPPSEAAAGVEVDDPAPRAR